MTLHQQTATLFTLSTEIRLHTTFDIKSQIPILTMRAAKLLSKIQSKSSLNARNPLNRIASRQFNDIFQPRSQLHKFLLKEPLDPFFYHHPVQAQMSRELRDIHNQFHECLDQSSNKMNKFLSNSTGYLSCLQSIF